MRTTRMRGRVRALAGLSVAAMVATGLLAVTFNAHARDANEDGALHHVTLGDSFSSGHGASHKYLDNNCRISEAAYTKTFFEKWRSVQQPTKGSSFKNVACTGAKVADVVAKQLPAVTKTTDMVALTIGGNDLHFASAATTCTLQSSADCNLALNDILARMDSVRAPINNLLNQIRSRAALNSTIILIGYPIIFDTGACGPLAISEDNRGRLRSLQTSFNEMLKDIAAGHSQAAGRFVYVESDVFFLEHRICDADRWINQVTDSIPLLDVGASYHPNAKGQAAIGQAIFNELTGANLP